MQANLCVRRVSRTVADLLSSTGNAWVIFGPDLVEFVGGVRPSVMESVVYFPSAGLRGVVVVTALPLTR
jgi:hypothetical protein